MLAGRVVQHPQGIRGVPIVTTDLYILAFEEGKQARLTGQPRNSNPYKGSARAINCWDAGWIFGKR